MADDPRPNPDEPDPGSSLDAPPGLWSSPPPPPPPPGPRTPSAESSAPSSPAPSSPAPSSPDSSSPGSSEPSYGPPPQGTPRAYPPPPDHASADPRPQSTRPDPRSPQPPPNQPPHGGQPSPGGQPSYGGQASPGGQPSRPDQQASPYGGQPTQHGQHSGDRGQGNWSQRSYGRPPGGQQQFDQHGGASYGGQHGGPPGAPGGRSGDDRRFPQAGGPQGPSDGSGQWQLSNPSYGYGPPPGQQYGGRPGQVGQSYGQGQPHPGQDQHASTAYRHGDRLPGSVNKNDGQDRGPVRAPRYVVALAIVVVALVTTAFTANWIRTKADALSPVAIPAPVPSLPTVSPKGYIKPEIADGMMMNTLGDKLPTPPSPPWKDFSDVVTYQGVAMWLTVHENYDGKKSNWGNAIGFGIFQPEQKYKDLRDAAALVGGRMINRLYDDPNLAPIKGSVKHRDLTIDGHKAHEIVARIPVKKAKLNETTSILAILVVDRGDKTLAVTWGDIAGSTPQWLEVWRQNATKMKLAN